MRPLTPALAALSLLACGCSRSGGSAATPPSSPPPNGRLELQASREAVGKLTHFTLEITREGERGTFRDTLEVDCAKRYYHKRSVIDLSPRGVEGGAPQLQGRPRAHQEREDLYVDGLSFTRSSGTWETPAAGENDARPDWTLHHTSFGERADCGRILAAENPIDLPYAKIAKATRIDFIGVQSIEAIRCNEFRVTYDDTVWGELKETRGPDGMLSANREMVTQPVEARICVGVLDKLPYRSEQTNLGSPETRRLSYGEITTLPPPTAR